MFLGSKFLSLFFLLFQLVFLLLKEFFNWFFALFQSPFMPVSLLWRQADTLRPQRLSIKGVAKQIVGEVHQSNLDFSPCQADGSDKKASGCLPQKTKDMLHSYPYPAFGFIAPFLSLG